MNKQDCAVCSNPVEYIVSMVLYLQAAVNLCGPINRLFAAFLLRLSFPLPLLHIPEPATDRTFLSREEETAFPFKKVKLTAAAAGWTRRRLLLYLLSHHSAKSPALPNGCTG